MKKNSSYLIAAFLTAMLSMSNTQTNVHAQAYTDVVYASKSPSNKLDVYFPSSGTGPFPTIIMIHGGGYSGGDKGGESTWANSMVSRGFAVASINYRLSGEAIFPAQIYDVKAAIRYLKANASTYLMDTNKFATWGESAGGGLAALASTSGGDTIVEDMTMGNSNHTSKVKACVDFSCPIDFLTMNSQLIKEGFTTYQDHDTATSPESVLVGGKIQTKKALCNEYNPGSYASSDDGYFWLEYGTADNGVPYLQGVELADSLSEYIPANRILLHIIAGAGHVDSKFFTDANLDSIAYFLAGALNITNNKMSITKVYASSSNAVKVIFNGPVGSSAENAANYSGIGTILAVTRSANLDTVTLSLAKPLINGNSYVLSIANIKDSSGYKTLDTSSYTIIYNNSLANMVITEIMYMYKSSDKSQMGPNASGTETGDSLQYVELYNNSGEAASLGGYILVHNSNSNPSTLYQFPGGTTIEAKSFTVYAKNSKAVENFFGISNVFQWLSGQSFSNTGDYLGLINTVGNVIDSFNYGTTSSGSTGTMPSDTSHTMSSDTSHMMPSDTSHIMPSDTTHTMPSDTMHNVPSGGTTTYKTIYSIVLCDVSSDNSKSSNWSDATDSVGTINSVSIYGNPGKGCPEAKDTTKVTGVSSVSSGNASLILLS